MSKNKHRTAFLLLAIGLLAATLISGCAGQRASGDPDGLELELAAANGADRIAVGKHRHPGPNFTRRRALRRIDQYEHRRLARQPFEQRLDQRPLHGLKA